MRLNALLTALTLAASAMGAQALVIPLNPITLPAAPANLLVNGDFESNNVSANDFKYINYYTTTPVSATGWVFSGGTGVANQSQAWGGAATGSAVAFLQSYPGLGLPVLTQTFSSGPSSLSISFNAAQRPGNQESLRVLLDNVDLTPGLLTPAGSGWTSYTLSSGLLSGGSHTLSFVGVNNSGATDSSLFIDSVVVLGATVPEPGSLALTGLALAAVGAVSRRRAAAAQA